MVSLGGTLVESGMTANIVNLPGNPAPVLEALSDEELIAQMQVQHGAIHALQELIRRGANRITADEMLRGLVAQQREMEREHARRRRARRG